MKSVGLSRRVYDKIRGIVDALGLGMVKIIPCSVRRIRGRILLWKRLWRSVNPDYHPPPGQLLEGRQERA